LTILNIRFIVRFIVKFAITRIAEKLIGKEAGQMRNQKASGIRVFASALCVLNTALNRVNTLFQKNCRFMSAVILPAAFATESRALTPEIPA
jgi:hypothetical protein